MHDKTYILNKDVCLIHITFFLSMFSTLCLCPLSLWCRSHSAGRLSDVLLMAAFGPGGLVGDRGSTENLTHEKAIDIIGRHVCPLTSTNI